VSRPEIVITDGTFVYWGNGGTALGTGGVYRSDLDGTNVTPLATNQNPVFALAVDATSVFFGTSFDNAVFQVPIAGGAIATLATTTAPPNALAVDGAWVYWAVDGNLGRTPAAGGSSQLLLTYNSALGSVAPGIGHFAAMAFDATYVYSISAGSQFGTGALFRVAKP
jgi:hypothetical protein